MGEAAVPRRPEPVLREARLEHRDPARTWSRSWRRRPVATCGRGRRSGWRRPGSPPSAPRVELDPDGCYSRVVVRAAGRQPAGGCREGPAAAPRGARRLPVDSEGPTPGRRRAQAGPGPARRGGGARRRVGGARAGRGPGRRPAAGQRRRPDLRQGAARCGEPEHGTARRGERSCPHCREPSYGVRSGSTSATGSCPPSSSSRRLWRGLADEDQSVIIETVRGLLVQARTRLVAPELRAEVSRRVCAATAAMLAAAEPGSDQQLAHARVHFASAVDPGRLARIGDLLAGRAEIAGLRAGGRPALERGHPAHRTGGGRGGAGGARAGRRPDQQGAAVRRPCEGGDADPGGQAEGLGCRGARTTDCPTSCSRRRWQASRTRTRPTDLLDPYRPMYAEQHRGTLRQARERRGGRARARGCSRRSIRRRWTSRTLSSRCPTCRPDCGGCSLERRDDVLRALACQEVSRAAG